MTERIVTIFGFLPCWERCWSYKIVMAVGMHLKAGWRSGSVLGS